MLVSMTKLAEIQEVILQLDRDGQERFRIWLDQTSLDLEDDSPELEVVAEKALHKHHGV